MKRLRFFPVHIDSQLWTSALRATCSAVLISIVASRVISVQAQEARPKAEGAAAETAPRLQSSKLGNTPNTHIVGSLYLAGQPDEEDISQIKKVGIRRVITLRGEDELPWDERKAVENEGLTFTRIPFRGLDSLNDATFDRVRQLLRDSGQPTLLHCRSATRVGAVWLPHRVLDQGVPLSKALEEAGQVGLGSKPLRDKAVDYIRRNSSKNSVRPGINATFKNAGLNVDQWLQRFETESREVFAAREEVLRAVALREGDRVADVGAGTGFYSRMFSDAVGSGGRVYAVDISPRMLEHIAKQAKADGLTNLETVRCLDNSVVLPPTSIDVAFICDTYHHFEFPQSTLASIHRALRPGGVLVLIDFERIPGKSREWTLNHVRAGKDAFRGELETAGFRLEKEIAIQGFEENYLLRFRRP